MLSAWQLSAQQDALFNQYMFNPFAVNPAYAGLRESVSGVLLHRNQWVGIEGAPVTQTLAIHGPIKNKKIAFGANFFHDRIGPTKNVGAFGTFAYHLKLREAKLSMAVRGGVYSSSLNRNELEYFDEVDGNASLGNLTSTVPSFDFGAFYMAKKFYMGLSISHLTNSSLEFEESTTVVSQMTLKSHIMLMSGAIFNLGEKVIFKPSTLIKVVENAPVNIDLNANFLINKLFWLGTSIRSSGGLVFLTEWNITDNFRIGYSYDVTFSSLNRFSGGSHELFVGFDFATGKVKSVSPRFM